MVFDLYFGQLNETLCRLFVRGDSAYKKRALWDCYDISRDALSFALICLLYVIRLADRGAILRIWQTLERAKKSWLYGL